MLHAGAIFDRYQIEDLLGEGGMGLVYRALDTRLRRRIALKIVRPEVAHEADGRTLSEAALRLIREGKAASAFSHPNAVSVYEVGEWEGIPFIAMELVEGHSLNEYLGDARVPLERRIAWLSGIARGLGAAHASGLVHRDVKPENIMVCAGDHVKVLDFGVAKQIHKSFLRAEQPGRRTTEHSVVTMTGVVVGTPLYMAPEQVLDEPLDGRSDQFAWGSMAYELLSDGVHPVSTNNPRNLPLQFAVLREEPLPLDRVAPLVPARVAEVVMRALHKRAQDRFATMEEIADALETFLGRRSGRLTREPEPSDAAATSAMPRYDAREEATQVRSADGDRTMMRSEPPPPQENTGSVTISLDKGAIESGPNDERPGEKTTVDRRRDRADFEAALHEERSESDAKTSPLFRLARATSTPLLGEVSSGDLPPPAASSDPVVPPAAESRAALPILSRGTATRRTFHPAIGWALVVIAALVAGFAAYLLFGRMPRQ